MLVLVVFKRDYSDEFECQECILLEALSASQVREFFQEALRVAWEEEAESFYFGTNEGYEANELRLERDFSFHEISPFDDTIVREFFLKMTGPHRWAFGTGVVSNIVDFALEKGLGNSFKISYSQKGAPNG